MKREDLIAALETVADAPTGIPQLRDLVVQLAVSGLLTQQDPTEEPASALLDRVAAERARLVQEKLIRKPKCLPAIEPDEHPFELPEGWQHARLGDVVTVVRGITFPASAKNKAQADGLVACLRTTNVQAYIEWDDLLFVPEEYVKRQEQFVKKDDIVMSMANSRELVGKVAIINRDVEGVTFGGFLSVIRPTLLLPQYVMTVLRDPSARQRLIDSSTQTTNIANISLGRLNPFILGVPPLAEQHRIVARVDELMALLDRLEAAKEARDATRAQLRDSALAALQDANDAELVKTAWSRVADNMHDLFTDPADIQPLRQTVLELATRGRLTNQDAAEEPASKIVEQVAERQKELVLERAIPRPKPLPTVSPEEVPFDVPQGWRWVRIQEITTLVTDGVHKTPTYVEEGIPFLSIKDISAGKLDFSATRYIPEHEHREINKRCNPSRGDLLFCRIGTLGRAVVVDTDRPFSLFVSVGLLKISEHLDARYLCFALNSPSAYAQYERIKAGGSHTNKLNLGAMRSAIVPLPPREEQHRIVAMVDELTAVIDRLEKALTSARCSQEALSASAVSALPSIRSATSTTEFVAVG